MLEYVFAVLGRCIVRTVSYFTLIHFILLHYFTAVVRLCNDITVQGWHGSQCDKCNTETLVTMACMACFYTNFSIIGFKRSNFLKLLTQYHYHLSCMKPFVLWLKSYLLWSDLITFSVLNDGGAAALPNENQRAALKGCLTLIFTHELET